MERLTYVDKQSRKIYLYSSSADVIGKLAEYEDLEEQCIKDNAIGIKLLIEKWKEFLEDMHELLEYRKMKEQGRLLILPCAVGDVVYAYLRAWRPEDGIVPYKITNITITQNKKGVWTKKYRAMWLVDGKTRDHAIDFSFGDLGKTTFATIEEAEAALEKMKGEEHE